MDMPEFTGTEPCTEIGTDMFFPDEVTGRQIDARKLRAVCAGCEMLEPCRDYALRHQVLGFWGGMTEYDRRRVRQRAGIVAAPVYESA